MKLSKFTIDKKSKTEKCVLSLSTFIFLFLFINNSIFISSKSTNLMKTKSKNRNLVLKEKSTELGIEEQEITINILNNETYFIGSAKGMIKLKQNQINVKNKNYYGGILNIAFNDTEIKNLTEQKKNNTQIILSKSNHLSDFFDYFPNFGKMINPTEMDLDLRYIWNCTYKYTEHSNSASIVMNMISKESATQHGFKVEFRFNSEKNTKELLRDYFENLMRVCVITQKSAVELKKELNKLIVRSINVKKHIVSVRGEESSSNSIINNENKNSNSNQIENTIGNGLNNTSNNIQNNSNETSNPNAQTGEQANDNNGSDGEAPLVNPDIPQDINSQNDPDKKAVSDDTQADGQSSDSLAKKSGSLNNKILKPAMFMETKTKLLNNTKAKTRQDENGDSNSPLQNNDPNASATQSTEDSSQPAYVGNGNESNQDNSPAENANADDDSNPKHQTGAENNSTLIDNKENNGSVSNQNKIPPQNNNNNPNAGSIDGNGLTPIIPSDNNNNINNGNNNPNTKIQNLEKHIHSKDTLIINNHYNEKLKPENITDPIARQKYQKANDDYKKNTEKLKSLAEKKKEIIKSINDLYNKINSEGQSKEILAPIAQMEKTKIEKAQEVVDIAKAQSDQMSKQAQNFLAQKQALNNTQEQKKQLTYTLEKDFQEQKGKFDELNQIKQHVATTISQYNSNVELAAKKIKASMEKKNALLRRIEKIQSSIDSVSKEIEDKSQDIKIFQQSFDNVNKKVETLKDEIKLFEDSLKNVSKKQDDLGKKIDKAESEKLKKQSYGALTKLSVLEGPLSNAKKAVLDLVDPAILNVFENGYNIVVDKDNNDSSAFDIEMNKIPKFIWTNKK